MRRLTLLKTVLVFGMFFIANTICSAQATLPVNATFTTVTSSGAGTMPTGFTHSGLTGYTGALKFDTQGDWLQLNFSTTPGTLSFDLGVNNTFPGTISASMTFSLDESADGTIWTSVSTYTNVPGGTKTVSTLKDVTRFLRWTYTTKPSGSNISFKNVILTAGISCNQSNLSFTTNTVSKIVGAAAFTQTATSLNTDPVSYSSSATSVATVNQTTGEVTPLTIGTTTITATQAASNGYCAATATYTLNITAAPTLTVTDVTNTVLISSNGSPVTQIINVSAVNLTTDLGLAISGPNADLFTLSQSSVTQTGGNVPNTAITITYTPLIGTNHSATLTMASTGAFDLARPISGINNATTDVNSVISALNVYAYNGKINVTAKAGESLDIYNSVGQRLMHSITTEGLNSIIAPANGVLMVKLGNQITKVIL